MRFALTLILCGVSLTTSAQLTPAIYRDQVAANSLELQSAAATLERSRRSVAYERTSRLPQLSASGRFAYNVKRVDDEYDWGSYVEPQIVQTLYGGGVVRATIESAELTSQMAQESADYTRQEVEYAADYAYWNLWAMGRYYAAMRQYVELIEGESEVIKRRFEEGYVAKSDMLMISARLSEAEYELISASQNRQVAQSNLNILRGVPPTDSVKLIRLDDVNTQMPRRLSIEEVVSQRHDYAASLLAESVASEATKAVKGSYNPHVSGGISGSWRSANPRLAGANHTLNGTIYVSVTLPIYHFGERRKATAISLSDESQSRINTSILRQTIEREENTAWVNLVESRSQMMTATRSLEIASENLAISTYAYNEGEVSIVELMQAQISWIQIYTNAINAEYNYQVARSYYRRISGSD